MNLFNDHLVLFGGIHDITWELDDLWVFDIKNNRWRLIYEDTTRRKDQDSMSLSPVRLNKSQQKKKVSGLITLTIAGLDESDQ